MKNEGCFYLCYSPGCYVCAMDPSLVQAAFCRSGYSIVWSGDECVCQNNCATTCLDNAVANGLPLIRDANTPQSLYDDLRRCLLACPDPATLSGRRCPDGFDFTITDGAFLKASSPELMDLFHTSYICSRANKRIQSACGQCNNQQAPGIQAGEVVCQPSAPNK